MSSNPAPATTSVPERLLAFLDRLSEVIAARGDAVALLGVGSVGRDLHRLDEHSDADFFVVVDDARAQARYLADIDWLEAAHPVVWSFENSPFGRKALLADGLFAEYAVFSLTDLDTAGYPPARVHWRRADAPDGLDVPRVPLPEAPPMEHQVGEAITNLYVGLHRDLRGERLTATRFIQGYAVDRWITILGRLGLGSRAQQDAFVIDRSVERRFPPELLPLADLVPGYERNAHAAATLLGLLEEHVALDPSIVAEVRGLIERAAQTAERGVPSWEWDDGSGGESPGDHAEEDAEGVRRPVHPHAREKAPTPAPELAREQATQRGEDHGAGDDGDLGERAQLGHRRRDRLVAGGGRGRRQDVPQPEEHG